MTNQHYSLQIGSSIERVQEAVSDPALWFPFLPGYESHNQTGLSRYEVSLHLLAGPLDRHTRLSFAFQSAKQKNASEFTFHSSSNKVNGSGKMLLSPLFDHSTELEVSLNFKVNGRSGILMKPFLPSLERSWAESLLNALKEELEP